MNHSGFANPTSAGCQSLFAYQGTGSNDNDAIYNIKNRKSEGFIRNTFKFAIRKP